MNLNLQKDDKSMPPPLSSKVRRRGASGRRGVASHSRSTPSTPDQVLNSYAYKNKIHFPMNIKKNISIPHIGE